jgi:L-fucose isomerase-like protein
MTAILALMRSCSAFACWSACSLALVPVLVQAYPDDLDQYGVERRRDAFCGKISVCNNLRQYGIPFRLTESRTVPAGSDEFRRDLEAYRHE